MNIYSVKWFDTLDLKHYESIMMAESYQVVKVYMDWKHSYSDDPGSHPHVDSLKITLEENDIKFPYIIKTTDI